MGKKGWRERIERQLEVVQRWRRSGQSVSDWAAANGVDRKLLFGWISYERRWQQMLAQAHGQALLPGPQIRIKQTRPGAAHRSSGPVGKGFVAVRSGLPSSVQAVQAVHGSAMNDERSSTPKTQPHATSVRIELMLAGQATSAASLVLHWPLAHGQELAIWLKAMNS